MQDTPPTPGASAAANAETSPETCPPLVLVSGGTAAEVAGRLERLAPALAHSLRLPLAPALDPAHPHRALAALADRGPALVPLPLDPGLPQDDGSHWAEALGAWRQPTLVVCDGPQLASGLPAAITALLRQWAVPCAGLIQCGGLWLPQRRRRDGLPWLGALAAEGAEDAAALRASLRRRLQQLPQP